MANVRHKVFISYHHADQREVSDFINKFDEYHNIFITRALDMSNDIINSNDTDYVMRRIRELYLQDTTITIVLIGKCTWARKYVDWEIQSSLRSGQTVTPNGLLGIVLPSASQTPTPPDRLKRNLKRENGEGGFADWYLYPQTKDILANCVEKAFQARTSKANLIVNPRERFSYNRECP